MNKKIFGGASTLSVFLLLASATKWVQNGSAPGLWLLVSAVAVFAVGFLLSLRLRD